MSTTDISPPVVLPAEALGDLAYERHSAAELEEYAGLAEHPDETLRRLEASGVWEREAQKFFNDELSRNRKNPALRKRARREAWRAVQDIWKPPSDAVPMPTILEQQQRAKERAKAAEGRRAEKAEERGTRPPKLKPEEKEHFRRIDAEMASGRLRRDSLDDMQWVYEHLDDDEVTAMDAPSRGAWTRLFHARYNRVKFLDSTWPAAEKELTKRKSAVKVGTVSEGEQKVREELRGMIKDAVAHAIKMGESVTEGEPEFEL